MQSLKLKVFDNVLWNFLEQVIAKGIGIAATLILAWFLSPNDYALIAMLTVFISLASAAVDGGFGQALIRKTNLKSVDLSTVFWTNLILSLVIYGLAYAVAPFIAEFYKEESLVSLIRVSSLSVFFQSLVVVPQAILSRSFQFKLQLRVVLPAAILSSLIAILLAFMDYGVWALIAQIVFNAVFIAIFFWRLSLWRPSFVFCFGSLAELWKFSKFIVIDSFASIPFQNMYLIVLPKYFAAGPIGWYFLAHKLKQVLLNLAVVSVQTVTYPALAQVRQDTTEFRSMITQVMLLTAFLLSPVLFFLSALSPLLFESFLPEKWHGSAVYFQLMCLAGLFNPIASINLNVLRVKGYSNIVFYIGVVKKALAIAVFICTLPYGITEVIVGQIAVSIIGYVPNAYYSTKLLNYSIPTQLSDFLPSFVLSGVIASMIFWLQYVLDWRPIYELASLGLIAAMLYLAVASLLNLKGYQLALNLLKRRFNKWRFIP